jgi:heparin binding hemagglutinin HbhA
MAITDDVRKTLSDPTPLYFMAGTADLAAQKLREVPTLVEKIVAEAPERFNAVRNTDPKAVQDRVTQQAKEAQDKLGEMLGSLDTDIKRLRDTAQDLALQGVGRAAELAVKARERYDEVAEHGQEVVKTWRGEAADEVVDIASAIEPKDEPGSTSQSVAVDSSKEAPKATAKPATPAKKAPARKPTTPKNPGAK